MSTKSMPMSKLRSVLVDQSLRPLLRSSTTSTARPKFRNSPGEIQLRSPWVPPRPNKRQPLVYPHRGPSSKPSRLKRRYLTLSILPIECRSRSVSSEHRSPILALPHSSSLSQARGCRTPLAHTQSPLCAVVSMHPLPSWHATKRKTTSMRTSGPTRMRKLTGKFSLAPPL